MPRPARAALAVAAVLALGAVACSGPGTGADPDLTLPGGGPITTREVRPGRTIVVAAGATAIDDRGLVRSIADLNAPCRAGDTAAPPIDALVTGAEVTVEDGVTVVGRGTLGPGRVTRPAPDSWVCRWDVTIDPGPPDGPLSVSVDGTLVGTLDLTANAVVDVTGDVIASGGR